ncbi:MAG: hypothetical protein K2Q26_05415 [Bdellovibrionales bacterium]|nr:hypothetical protein [Bdellovibrionales bacterium]
MFKTFIGLTVFTLGLSCHSGTRHLAQAPQPRTLKILALGDSLTAGVANNGGYRPHLYILLKNAGFSVDFLGSNQQGPPDMPDPDHEGYGGYRIDQLGPVVEKSLGTFKPDLILLGAGGNDIAQNFKLDSAHQRLVSLIRKIHKLSPQAIVIVQSRPPRADHLNAKVIEFNSKLQKEITREMKHNKQLYFQDNFKLLTAEDIGPDGFHPNDRGNQKLAEGWFNAIQRILRTSIEFSN